MALVFRNAPELARADKRHSVLELRMGIHSGPSAMTDVNDRTNITGAGTSVGAPGDFDQTPERLEIAHAALLRAELINPHRRDVHVEKERYAYDGLTATTTRASNSSCEAELAELVLAFSLHRSSAEFLKAVT